MSREPQRRLGRGLSAILPGDDLPTDPAISADRPPVPPLKLGTRMTEVPVERVRPNPFQPRKRFDDLSLRQLAASLLTRGALQPIVVRPAGDGYQLVAGERRWRAARMAGLGVMPAIIRETSDEDLLELALIENLHREDLNPVDRAKAYLEIKSRLNISNEELAERLGEDRVTVANFVRLLDLPDDVLELLADGSLSVGHAKAVLGLAETTLRSTLALRAVEAGWTVRQTEDEVRKLSTERPAGATAHPAKRPAVAELERMLSEAIGTKVTIREGRRRHHGRVVIEYYSLDDFERITTRLGVDKEA